MGIDRARLFRSTELHAHGRARWVVRIISGSYATIAMLWLLANILLSDESVSPEGVILGTITICMCLALISAWKFEGLGGLAVVVLGIAMFVFVMITAGRNQLIVATVLAGPVIASGITFLRLALGREIASVDNRKY